MQAWKKDESTYVRVYMRLRNTEAHMKVFARV